MNKKRQTFCIHSSTDSHDELLIWFKNFARQNNSKIKEFFFSNIEQMKKTNDDMLKIMSNNNNGKK